MLQTRRSVYQLINKASISDDELKALVERAVKHTPTSFNMQQSRAVLVLGDKHHQLWDTIAEKAVKGMPGECQCLALSSIARAVLTRGRSGPAAEEQD